MSKDEIQIQPELITRLHTFLTRYYCKQIVLVGEDIYKKLGMPDELKDKGYFFADKPNTDIKTFQKMGRTYSFFPCPWLIGQIVFFGTHPLANYVVTLDDVFRFEEFVQNIPLPFAVSTNMITGLPLYQQFVLVDKQGRQFVITKENKLAPLQA